MKTGKHLKFAYEVHYLLNNLNIICQVYMHTHNWVFTHEHTELNCLKDDNYNLQCFYLFFFL